jgi:hypothetical protein
MQFCILQLIGVTQKMLLTSEQSAKTHSQGRISLVTCRGILGNFIS